ncbi:MAG: HD domain-containing phosphohydrolase [bacterium]
MSPNTPAIAPEAARALTDEARGLVRSGHRAEARVLYERALREFAEPSPVMASTLLRWIARTYELDSDYQAAADCAEAAVAAAEASGDKRALGSALSVLAAARWREGYFTVAERLFRDVLACGTSAIDPRLHVEVLTNLGSIAKTRGDYREALKCYQDAVIHGRRHSLLDNVVVALNNLGLANVEVDRLDAAEAAFEEAAMLANTLGALSLRAQVELNGVLLQIARRDFGEAGRRCHHVMALASELGDSRTFGEIAKAYGIIARETGDAATAETELEHARDRGAAIGDKMLEGEANRELAELYRRLGRNRETLQALNRAHACYTELTNRHELADVGRLMSQLEGAYMEVVRAWCEAVEAKEGRPSGQTARVADLAVALAANAGFDEASLFWLRIGAMLYDVGKLGVPDEVLNKSGQLTSEEWALVSRHPLTGVEMLADLHFPWDIAPMVRSHHERWDGQGYPDGIAGEVIPFAGRILCIADMFDALTTARSYKRSFSRTEAMEIMRREAGKQFDPHLFAHFEEIVRRGHPLSVSPPPMPRPRSGGYAAIDATEEDDLTGALLRRAFVDVTSAVLAERKRTGAPVSLLVVDVDQFKTVNDTFGHLAGDDALRLLAAVAREHLKPGQYLGRYAGDEFVVVLPGLDQLAARAVADDIRRATASRSVPLRNEVVKALSVTVSIGVASAPAHGETFEALFTSADRALFEAKRGGRDKVFVAGSESDGPPRLAFNRFVGRTGELRSLVDALDQSLAGTPQVRLIIGEAGVGKSTLVRQLLPEARLRGAVMATGRALDAENRPPYGPWAEVISTAHALGLTSNRPWPLLERLAPSLRDAASAGDVAPPIDPRHGHQLLHELLAYLQAASVMRPLVIALEDMHWADVASWDALEFLLAHVEEARLTFAVTLRSEEAAYGTVRERRQRLSRDERAREIHVIRLTEGEVRNWLQGVLHRGELGDDLVLFVLRHTEGNPFLVVQLLRTMSEEGVFTHSGTAWTWTIPSALALPIGMSDLVGRRLSRLPEEALRVLVTAAAIGRTFSLALLANAADLPMEKVLDAIDSGLASSVIEPVRSTDARDVYQFAHALLVDSVLRTVSPARQRYTHERIANYLAKKHPAGVDVIASHFSRSGNTDQAYTWCRAAAVHAVSLYALDDATHFLELALGNAGTDPERAAVFDELARVAELSGHWADVERWAEEMLALPLVHQQAGRALTMQLRRLQARVRLGQSTLDTEAECREMLSVAERVAGIGEVLQTRSLLAQMIARRGDVAEAILIARASLKLAHGDGDDALVGEATLRLAITLLGTNPAEAVELLLELLARPVEQRDRAMEARAFLTLGVARTFSLDDRAGMEAFRSALALAREAQALDLAASASMNLGVLELRRGNFPAAQEACTDALRLYTTLRNNASRLIALYNLANLELERGDAEAAMALYRETSALAEQLGAADIAIGAQAGVGIAALRFRDVGEARTSLGSAVQRIGDRDDWWFQGRELFESLIIRLAAHDGALAEARARFYRGVERLEPMDVYAAAWMVADCAADIADEDPGVWAVVERMARHPAVREFVPLAVRFTALHDMEERLNAAHLRVGHHAAT